MSPMYSCTVSKQKWTWVRGFVCLLRTIHFHIALTFIMLQWHLNQSLHFYVHILNFEIDSSKLHWLHTGWMSVCTVSLMSDFKKEKKSSPRELREQVETCKIGILAHSNEHYTTPRHEHAAIATPNGFHLVILTWTFAIILLNALNNSYWCVGTRGQEVEHFDRGGRHDRKTAKFPARAAFLSIYCQGRKKKNWSRDTKETEGEAISLLLRLINNNLMQGRKEKSGEAQFGIASRHAESLKWAKGTHLIANGVLYWCITPVWLYARVTCVNS